MATINRSKLGVKPRKASEKDSFKKWTKYYNDQRWKDLRMLYLQEHPLCECCLAHGRIVPAEHVHHKAFLSFDDIEEHIYKRMLNENNLMSVCKTCHRGIHKYADMKGQKFKDSLTKDEYEEEHQLKWMV